MLIFQLTNYWLNKKCIHRLLNFIIGLEIIVVLFKVRLTGRMPLENAQSVFHIRCTMLIYLTSQMTSWPSTRVQNRCHEYATELLRGNFACNIVGLLWLDWATDLWRRGVGTGATTGRCLQIFGFLFRHHYFRVHHCSIICRQLSDCGEFVPQFLYQGFAPGTHWVISPPDIQANPIPKSWICNANRNHHDAQHYCRCQPIYHW